MPGWTMPAWRKALQRPENVTTPLQSLLDGGRLGPLLAWVTSRARPSQHLGVAAAARRSWTAQCTRANGTSRSWPGSCRRRCWPFGPFPPGCVRRPGPIRLRSWSVNPIRRGRTSASADHADSPFRARRRFCCVSRAMSSGRTSPCRPVGRRPGRCIGPLGQRCPTWRRAASLLCREPPAFHQTTGSTAWA